MLSSKLLRDGGIVDEQRLQHVIVDISCQKHSAVQGDYHPPFYCASFKEFQSRADPLELPEALQCAVCGVE